MLLVVTYGLGMASTLTLAGILLVTIRDRMQARLAGTPGRARRLAQRWSQVAPWATATLVLVVGVALAVRGASLV
ncbi:MAG: hypothetical protein R2705_19295 [Ilumatobacteraceae bacterium]